MTPKENSSGRIGLLLFLFVWLVYGATINSGNLEAFNLQQSGVEALVERHHFYLEGSQSTRLRPNPRYDGARPIGDSFIYGEHVYLSKQPGQVMAGALVYYPLHRLGLTYVNQYLLTAAPVTFFTASLVAAFSVLAVFRFAREFLSNDTSCSRPLLIALCYGLATTMFPYAGIAHHDALATGYLVIAFYLMFRVSRTGSDQRRLWLPLASGFLLGLTLTTSMLLLPAVIILGVYFVSLRRWKSVPLFLFCALLGLAPMLIFNAVSFGNPLLLPNVAGNYQDTFARVDPVNFVNKLWFYLSMLTLYTPVFWCGLGGLILIPREWRRERLVILGCVVTIIIFVLNLPADGGCQYGPRYLVPAMPFAALGLTGFGSISAANKRLVANVAVGSAALCSFLVNLAGAIHGAMYCTLDRYAPLVYLEAFKRGEWRTHPLAIGLVLPMIVCGAVLAVLIWKHYRRDPTRRAATATP